MQLSQAFTCGHSLASASQGSQKLKIFSGICQDCHLVLRDERWGFSYAHTFLNCTHIRTTRKFCHGALFVACWNDADDSSTSRNGSRAKEPTKGQRSFQSKVLDSSSECCSGLKEAARYACNDARIVNARAREGFVLLARGFERLDKRARQDVALLGSGFLKLDARARQDTVKLDIDARKNAARLRTMALGLSYKAQVQLKTAAEKHWSDGALDADLRLADLRAKRRAMEDAFMALQFVKSIHNGLVKKAYQRQSELENQDPLLQYEPRPQLDSVGIMHERLAALQDAYWDIASALAEADGIDYSDPEELELIIAALLDMDAVDGASSATMLAEWAKSPDVATRQALANALGNAPSLWALGNAGMGALQRLALDDNPAVAAAASKALDELKKQWQMDPQDMLTFQVDKSLLERLYFSEEEEEDEE